METLMENGVADWALTSAGHLIGRGEKGGKTNDLNNKDGVSVTRRNVGACEASPSGDEGNSLAFHLVSPYHENGLFYAMLPLLLPLSLFP